MSYEQAITGLELKVLAEKYIGDYQGDWCVVFKDEWDYGAGDKAYGFLVHGYGSCSGCDGWEASRNAVERLGQLIYMVENIHWFSNLSDLKEYVATRTNEDSWYMHEKEFAEFQAAVAALDEANV